MVVARRAQIAFDSFTDGHTHIWIIDADGVHPHQLTQDPGDQNVPYWSRDGLLDLLLRRSRDWP